MTDDPVNNENDIIQTSAHVSTQSLLSTSINSSSTAAATNSNLNSKKSSKSKLVVDGEEEGESGYYGGVMERFFQSEVKPVYFGDKNDAFLLLKVTLLAGLLVNLFGILVYMQYDDLIPQNPSEHHPHGLLRLFSAFESAFGAYYSDGQIVVGWMLTCWFLGYNVISAVIWWQFERTEPKVPDDYEILIGYRSRRNRLGSQGSNNPLSTQTRELHDPTISYDSFKRVSKSQLQQMNEPQNPYDKSVVVISMPNGDFSVGKRQKIIFVIVDDRTVDNLLTCVYWKFNENFFISLHGKVLQIKEDKIEISEGILEENSSNNLIKLFTTESIESATKSPNDPLSSLIESLVRLAQVNYEKVQKTNSKEYEIYFQNSIIIGGKREYPIYILKCEGNENVEEELMDLIERLKGRTYDEKADIIQEFYTKYPENNQIETLIFTREIIYEPIEVEELEKMMKSLKELKLTDLFNDQCTEDLNFNLEELNQIFSEMINKVTPSEKLEKLVQFHSKLTIDQNSEINADILLPLLTYVLLQINSGSEIIGQVKFIERFTHPTMLTGINNYILTSTMAAIEVMKSIYQSKNTPKLTDTPSSPSHFSAIISSIASIGQVPKAIASSITSTLTRSRAVDRNEEIDIFRERMLATNSSNDLTIRDINLLLEDYKNLLFLHYKL